MALICDTADIVKATARTTSAVNLIQAQISQGQSSGKQVSAVSNQRWINLYAAFGTILATGPTNVMPCTPVEQLDALYEQAYLLGLAIEKELGVPSGIPAPPTSWPATLLKIALWGTLAYVAVKVVPATIKSFKGGYKGAPRYARR